MKILEKIAKQQILIPKNFCATIPRMESSVLIVFLFFLLFLICDIWLQDEREGTPSGKDSPATLADNHGVEPTEEFKLVEHPLEPLDKDQPVRCPPLEPSILHVSTFSLSWRFF